MKTWLFYMNDIAVNVYEKKTLTAERAKSLKAEGFHRLPFDTEAKDESDAVDRMLQHFRENTEALAEYTKDMTIPAIIFSLL
ncbi:MULTISPECIES: hypothetical protein [Enterobacter]|uniref:hypothetical protein n=1 Tax=Enterobacter TaxID=547 RepID=UPI0015E945D1|nr:MULTISPECIES: hypothetical protein [Enterobacter]HDR2755489.1 hypothetical protein [Enterobacter asburiae]QMR77990.1 hypothetical protein HV107_21320 [Enterobacter sp. RHBSTW-00175]WNT38280.1 hypothetical protein RRL13_09335 [Enterobacter cloacae]HDR2790885.1 hypothetical protein [Enterobacter asburiae]HDR2791586.1 hypothetical protein [Enterobacter asburiae]